MRKISKYHDLYVFLDNITGDTVSLSFEKIEYIVNDKLPKSAYQYSAWWANGENSHAHVSAWQDSGYKVEEVKIGEYVVFTKTKIR